MIQRELEIKIVLETIEESKKQIAVLSDSVDPVSSTRETLIKIDIFIKEMEKEVVQQLPEVKRLSSFKHLFVFVPMLMPTVKLLKELLAEAEQVIEQFLR